MTELPQSTWPRGDGEMATRIRAFDWSQTPLGPIAAWTERYRAAVDTILGMPGPATVLWGPQHVQIYNDAYVAIAGARHPVLLGRPVAEGWPEVYEDVIAPLLATTAAGGAKQLSGFPVMLRNRNGCLTERVFDTAWSPIHDEHGSVSGALQTLTEVTEGHRAHTALRDGEARRSFLLALADAVRPLADPVRIQGEACRLLAEHLSVDRAYYVEVDEAAGVARVERDYVRNGAPSLAGEHPVASFSWSLDILRRGECHVIPDTQASLLVPEPDRPASAALGIIACMGAPLIKEGQLVGALCVTVSEPRDWRDDEVDLLRDVGERIWAAVERARAEARLEASEELFRSFAENSTDTLWIVDAVTSRLDYLSPAFAAMFGADPDHVRADLGRFAELVHPDDRSTVAAAIPKILSGGETYQLEYRVVRPSDGRVRWIQDTGFPIRDGGGRIYRIGGVAQDVTDRRAADDALRDREAQLQVMVAELHHRTRNLIGVTSMIARQLIASSTSLDDFRARFTERLEALSRVQSLFSRKENERITVDEIVRLELDALGADLASERVRIEGEAVVLKKSAVQTLSLAIHELATNARKYGALHADRGRLVVRWNEYVTEAGQRRLRFEWTETGIDPAIERTEGPLREGSYGRKLIEEALPYTLKAKTTYALDRDSLECSIDMPVNG